ncbi:hypothetical protein GCK32_014850 [Trichostrongylus colubriformis]|uniref:Uncharacterized protein n=1 Tax=Trichostrongylus colubriformis TaxID=6319 RepID=A0AAN8GDI9_TRICO
MLEEALETGKNVLEVLKYNLDSIFQKTCGDDIQSLEVERTQRGGREDGSDRDDREERRELADTEFFKEDAFKQKEKQSRVSTKENAVGKKVISVRRGSSKKKALKSRKKKSEKKGPGVKVRTSKSKKSLASKGKKPKDIKKEMQLYKGIYEAKLAEQKTQLQENIQPNSKVSNNKK